MTDLSIDLDGGRPLTGIGMPPSWPNSHCASSAHSSSGRYRCSDTRNWIRGDQYGSGNPRSGLQFHSTGQRGDVPTSSGRASVRWDRDDKEVPRTWHGHRRCRDCCPFTRRRHRHDRGVQYVCEVKFPSDRTASPGGRWSTAPAGAGTTRLGQPASDGKLAFTVNTVKCGIPSVGDPTNGFGAIPPGQFCDANMTDREHQYREPGLFAASLQYAFSPTGSKYSYSSSGTIWATRANFIAGINPGNSITTDVYYDIPVGSSIAKFELHDGVFSNGVTVLNK